MLKPAQKIDALVLANYGIIQPALPSDAELETKHGIRSTDERGIITSLIPLGEISLSERYDLYELARVICAA